MDRDQNRTSRANRQRFEAEEEQHDYIPPEGSGAPRRRRSQAARLRGEEPVTEDTIVPRPQSRETLESRRRYGRPGDAPVPQPRKRNDPYGDDLYDDDNDVEEYDDFDEEEKPRKKRVLVWVIVAVVLLLALGGITFFGLMNPGSFVEPVVQWGRNLVLGPTPSPSPSPEPTPDPTPTPEPIPEASAAVVIGFLADPQDQPDLNAPIVFQVTTTAQTDRVQIVDDNGQVLFEGGEMDYNDTDHARVWRLMVYFLNPYEGSVEAYPGNASGWNEAGGAKIPIKIGEPQEEPTADASAGDGGAAPMSADLGSGESILSGAGVVATTVEVVEQAYDKTGPVDTFDREHKVNMADAEGYAGTGGMNGVLTFRGSSMRQNSAYGVVAPAEKKLVEVWKAEGGIASEGEYAFGAQPLIVQWHANVRKLMEMNADKLEKSSLREVIFAGNNGSLYFYDLDDGTPTRDAILINPTMPMMGTPSVYPIGYPILVVGSGDPSDTNMEADTGMIVYNLIKNADIGMLPGNNEDAFSSDRTFITSPLIDNNSDTVIGIGGNGLLYSMYFKANLNGETKVLGITPSVEIYRTGVEGDDTTVDGSLASYGEYVYYASNGGVLHCVNVNTLSSVWALNVAADTDAAIAMDKTADGAVLYHATKADVEGLAHMRRINALNGAVEWDVSVPGSITASPLVGTGALEGKVFFAAMNSEAGGTIYALDASTGALVWEYVVMGKQLASPMALYDESGNAWIVQGDEGGLLLLDALTAERVDYLALDGAVYGAPAAFDDMIVVATQSGTLYGIQMK